MYSSDDKGCALPGPGGYNDGGMWRDALDEEREARTPIGKVVVELPAEGGNGRGIVELVGVTTLLSDGSGIERVSGAGIECNGRDVIGEIMLAAGAIAAGGIVAETRLGAGARVGVAEPGKLLTRGGGRIDP